MKRSAHRIAAALLFVILFCPGSRAVAQRKFDPIPDGPSKSNVRILDLFKPIVAKAVDSTVAVFVDGKRAAFGTIVKADGFILTKDSELRNDNITVKLKDGRELDARKIASNDTWDLAMLKIDAKDLKAITWDESNVAPVGNWVATLGPFDRPVAIGVVSVASRAMPPGPKIALPKNFNDRGYLGIAMEDDKDGEGVRVTKVSPKSPAEKAGLKAEDLVIAVDGKGSLDMETLRAMIGRHKPGDTVTLRLRRDGKEEDFKATLGKMPPEFGFDRGALQNSMGTDISERRTGFPITLQHDTDMRASQCGGPLVDIEGRVIGINIARGGRTDTYAIPSESIKPLLADMLAAKDPGPTTRANALTQKIKAAEAVLKEAESAKSNAEKKQAEAKEALDKLIAEQMKLKK